MKIETTWKKIHATSQLSYFQQPIAEKIKYTLPVFRLGKKLQIHANWIYIQLHNTKALLHLAVFRQPWILLQ